MEETYETLYFGTLKFKRYSKLKFLLRISILQACSEYERLRTAQTTVNFKISDERPLKIKKNKTDKNHEDG